jgi:hypothetical protein
LPLHVLESFALACIMAISAWFCSVDSDEALNASSLQFLRSIKRFITTTFLSAFNGSSPLLLMENHRLTLHRHYFFKEIHCLTLIYCPNPNPGDFLFLFCAVKLTQVGTNFV